MRTRRDSSLHSAERACQSCKLRKRKCDKALPRCSLCVRRKLDCEYNGPNTSPHSTLKWPSRLESGLPNPQSIDLPTLLFLDPGLLQHGQVDTNRFAPSIPPEILHFLGDMDELRTSAEKFFRHIHPWMPFISRKRFYDTYLQPPYHSRPDVVSLLLALKLITTYPPDPSGSLRTALYYATKHFLVEAEASFSILALQAGVLVALYEIGHGLYPAAYLSIGTCARYAYALGINVARMVPATKALSFVELEEKRRVWWAIVILDRFVNIGCPGRSFATADPEFDDLLPADDASWDQGIIKPDELCTVSAPMTGHMSKFALLCQAARLLGQVLRCLSYADDVDDVDDSWMQLDRTLQAMLNAALNIDCPDYDQITFIYSALIALHSPFLSPGVSQQRGNRRYRLANSVLQQVTDKINANLIERRCFLGREPEDMSPWGTFFAYRICVAHLQSTAKTADAVKLVSSLREAFQAISTRWGVAKVYLQLLEAHEANV